MVKVMARKRDMAERLIAMPFDYYEASGAEQILGAGRSQLTGRLRRSDPLQEPLKRDFRLAICVHQQPGQCVGRPSQPRSAAAVLAFAHRARVAFTMPRRTDHCSEDI